MAAAGGRARPQVWCGSIRDSDDRAHQYDNGPQRYHAIYAVPSDAPNRVLEHAGGLQADALAASGLLERLYGRAIRFDMGTECGSRYLDISVVRLRHSRASLRRLGRTDYGTLDAVASGLSRAGFPTITTDGGPRPADNYVVWLDGPAPVGTCGQAMHEADPRRDAENPNNAGGRMALVFRRGAGFCGWKTVLHEIGHTLGALQPEAPHAFDGAHCDDAREDVMCAGGLPPVGGAASFDHGNDDYWDPPGGALPWWTVNLSPFLCPDAGCNRVPVAAAARRRALSVRSARTGRRAWRVAVRVRGKEPAIVTVRCRGKARIAARRAPSRRWVRMRLRCPSKPRASAVGLLR